MYILVFPSRIEALKAWIAGNSIKKADLAKHINVNGAMITKIINSNTAPPKSIDLLENFGIPKYLLPSPSRGPGRPKGS